MKRLSILVLAVALTVGCTAITPTIATHPDGSWSFAAGQYALLDRLPGDDQQAETSTVTGFSVRDLSIGVAQRDVLRQPVATEPLYGVGFSREQTVQTATGDAIDSDYASGDAFLDESAEELADGDTTAGD